MRIVREQDWLTIHAPAKLNLFLEILARRPDGFHELETLMVAVGVFDTLQLSSRRDGQFELINQSGFACSAQSLGDVPSGPQNIIVRALEKLRDKAGIALGASVRLTKRIASAAGLGGASSDAAAVLLLANEAWQLRWTREQLSAVAAELGSDIPFFLGAPAAICRGRGEQIEAIPALPRLEVVIVRPPEGLSTPAVYKQCRPAEIPQHAAPLLAAWQCGNVAGLAVGMANRLEPAAARLSPWIERLRAAFAAQDCYGHQMSGSGSSYFGICRSAAHARRVAARLRAERLGIVYCTHTLNESSSKSSVAVHGN